MHHIELWHGKHFSAWFDLYAHRYYVLEHSNQSEFTMACDSDAVDTAKSWNARKAQDAHRLGASSTPAHHATVLP